MKKEHLSIEQAEEIIRATAKPYLLEEVEHFNELAEDRDPADYDGGEPPHTYFDGWCDVADRYECDKTYRRNVLEVWIALGAYVPISQEEYESVQCTHDKRRCYPKYKGDRYDWVGHDHIGGAQ